MLCRRTLPDLPVEDYVTESDPAPRFVDAISRFSALARSLAIVAGSRMLPVNLLPQRFGEARYRIALVNDIT